MDHTPDTRPKVPLATPTRDAALIKRKYAAIETIRSNKQRYAEAEAKIHAQRRFEGVTPPWMRSTPDFDGDEDVP